MYRRLLVPINNSAAAKRGLEAAIGLATDLDAQLRLVHVQPTEPADERPMLTVLEAARRQAVAAGVAADTQCLDPFPLSFEELIIEEPLKWQADLIIMGTHGRTGLPRLVHGSYAERLIRHSPIPILLVPPAGSASRTAGRLCEESAQ